MQLSNLNMTTTNTTQSEQSAPIPTFFCASFFPSFTLSAPPFPRQFSSPKSSLSGTSDLLFLVEKRQPPGAGFWGRFLGRGSPHRKKRKILFRRVRFQTPNSVSFSGLTEFRGANSVSSSQPIICVQTRTHRVFRRTHRVCPRTQ